MISRLHIENIAVIENADIDFRNGFIALTGETGAGKSILIDSINILLGNRASKDLVRTGCSKAFVSAEFDDVAGLEKLFSEYGVPDEGNGCKSKFETCSRIRLEGVRKKTDNDTRSAG